MNNKIQKIFPKINNLNNELKYDVEGLWSITQPSEANIISILIQSDIGYNSKILDATAGIGGNTISFANYFKNVTAIEIHKSRFEIFFAKYSSLSFIPSPLGLKAFGNISCASSDNIDINTVSLAEQPFASVKVTI